MTELIKISKSGVELDFRGRPASTPNRIPFFRFVKKKFKARDDGWEDVTGKVRVIKRGDQRITFTDRFGVTIAVADPALRHMSFSFDGKIHWELETVS